MGVVRGAEFPWQIVSRLFPGECPDNLGSEPEDTQYGQTVFRTDSIGGFVERSEIPVREKARLLSLVVVSRVSPDDDLRLGQHHHHQEGHVDADEHETEPAAETEPLDEET